MSGVEGVVGSGDFAPTAQARAVQAELVAAIRAELARLAAVRESAVPAINASALELAVPAVEGGSRNR